MDGKTERERVREKELERERERERKMMRRCAVCKSKKKVFLLCIHLKSFLGPV